MRDAYTELSNASGSAAAEQEKYINSLAGKLNALSENIKGIWIDAVDTGFVGDVVDSLNSLVSAFRWFTDQVGSMPAILSTVTLGFTAFSKQGRELAQSMANIVPGVNNVTNKINLLGNSLKDKRKNLLANIQSAEEYINKMRDTGVNLSSTQAKLKSYNAQLSKTKIAMGALKAATIAMNAALSAGISLLVSWGIEKLTSKIDEMITTKDELQQLNAEFNSKYGETGNTIKLIDEYKELSEQLRNTTRDSEEYSSVSNQLSAAEQKLVELYPSLNKEIEKNGDLKWKNVKAIEALTAAELEQAKAEARATLGTNKVSNYADIQKAVDTYNELLKKQREYSQAFDRGEKTVVTDTKMGFDGSDIVTTKNTAKALEEVNDQVKKSKETLESYYNSLNILGADGQVKFGQGINLVKEALGLADTEMQNVTSDVNLMGQEFSNAARGVEELSDAFSTYTQPIKLLGTMIEEFQKYGGLTDETYESVFASQNTELIALLGDADTFLEKANSLIEKLRQSQADTAKELINTAVAKEQEVLESVAKSANDTADSVTKSMERQSRAISEAATTTVNTEEMKSKYDELVNSVLMALNLTGNAAQAMEATVIKSIEEYVAAGNELYLQDIANKMSAEEAKKMASSMWEKDEIIKLAHKVNQAKELYDADMRNWANDVINKQTMNKTYADAVLSQIADMINLSAEDYTADTLHWSSALSNKSANNVRMVNAIIRNIADMIIAEQQNYNADTVNWAKAIKNKGDNNAILCTEVTNSMVNVINSLAGMYVTDVNNFNNSVKSKINTLNDFYKKANNSAFGMTAHQAFNPQNIRDLQSQMNKDNNFVSLNSPNHPNNKKPQVSQAPQVPQINPDTFVPQTVTGNNYVSNVGSAGSGSGSGSGSGKDVADLENVVDRYFSLNNALQKIENEISAIDTELDSKTGKDRIALIEKEIKLLDDKRMALINIRNEQQKELSELRSALAGKGFSFAADGQIANYHSQLNNLVASANSQTGEAKEQAIANVKEVISQLEQYTDLLLNDIPDITNKINGITGSVSNLREEIDQIIKDTTFFTKDFVDRYYELNNALKQVENQLNDISVAIKNADDNKMMELLDKQIELYVKQGEALAAIRKENVKELNELGKELYDAGFKFNQDGTLSNYQSLIDKMVQDANKITDGKKQEKAIERINELTNTIKQYTDLLLKDIPGITNDMDDLANSVIDSQNKIADILSKQKDEYIDNLKKETEALKQEVERRKEILQKQWEQEDAADELAEKQQKLNELEDQLTLALRTGDEELIKNIREQITAAQKEINDFIRNEERDYISDRFNEDLDKLDEDLNNKIDKINESLSDKELLNLVQSGVRDLTEVLNNIENGSKGVRSAFAAIGTTISETWINALDAFVDKLNSISDINLGFNVGSKLGDVMKGFNREVNITQGNLIVQGNITEDILPMVQGMIDTANNNLIRDINAAFSR